MTRWLLFLPVCLVGGPILVFLLLDQSSSGSPRPGDKPLPKVSEEGALPDAARMEELAQNDQVAFLKNCIRRYQREVRGYQLMMQKQERLQGTLYPKEKIEVFFRGKPHSVLMIWKEGARKAERVLYVEGENEDKMLVRPNGSIARLVAGDVTARPVDGPEAQQSGRFGVHKFGLKMSLERALASWQGAQDRGALHVDYLGLQPLAGVDGRICYGIHRVGDVPEDDGVLDQTLYVDKETWLPLGIIARGKGGELIGEYYFHVLKLNTDFPPGQFDRSALNP